MTPGRRRSSCCATTGYARSVSRITPHVLRLLAKRHHDLIVALTRAICRLHATVTFLVEGHLPRRLQAERAAPILAGIRPTTAIGIERKMLARELLAEVRRLDRERRPP